MPVSIISSSCSCCLYKIIRSCRALSLTLLFSENMTERGKFNISAVFPLYMLKTVSWLKTKTNSPTKRNNKESSIKNNTWVYI